MSRVVLLPKTEVQTIAAHSKCHDVQSTAGPSILDESGPKHPKDMPSSGQSGHIYEKIQKNIPMSGTIFLDNSSIRPSKCARMRAIRV